MSQEHQTTTLQAIKNPAPRETMLPDQKIDMFSLRGFELAQRIGRAFAASDAVPAMFRSHNLKKVGREEKWVENPAAVGNCIVAIETARSLDMSITAVMQNADIIEGKLRWTDKFIVGSINASGRFTSLRFDVKNLGPVTATYKEKVGWDDQARKPIFEERKVTLDNLQSIAWALPKGVPFPPGIYTYDQAKKAGLPVIEGPPVSMELAVEEGWYGKPGSKWQTGLKHKMLMMRSGRYFGDIHAPDITMGFGKSAEEEMDTIDMAVQPDGTYAVDLDALRQAQAPLAAPARQADTVDPSTGEVQQHTPASPQPEAGAAQAGTAAGPAGETSQQAAPDQQQDAGQAEGLSYAKVRDSLEKAGDLEVLDVAADLIGEVADKAQQEELRAFYRERKEALTNPPAAAGTTTRRTKPQQQNFNVE